MKLKLRNAINTVGVLWGIVVLAILLIGPRVVGMSTSKASELEQIVRKTESADREFREIEAKHKTATKKLKQVEAYMQVAMVGSEIEEMDLHMPSVVINLQEEASKLNLKMELTYEPGQFAVGTGEEDTEDEPLPEEPIPSEDEPDMGEDYDGEDEYEPSEYNEGDDGTIEHRDEEGNLVEEPKEIELENDTIEFKVTGKYLDVVKYVRYLDELDFIEPEHVHTMSLGNTVEAVIKTKIYYGGEE